MPPIALPALPRGFGRDTAARRAARRRLIGALFDGSGGRRLPADVTVAAALHRCDPRDPWWVCEANSHGPLYVLPTVEWIAALAAFVDTTRARRVLEVAAGDGFVSQCLRRARPGLDVIATDDGSWSGPLARQSARDRRAFAGISFAGIKLGDGVVRLAARAAVERFKPDLVIVCWAPPGLLVQGCIRAPCRLVLEVSVDGDVSGNVARTWRFKKEFLDGPVQDRALCRLDTDPRAARHTRVTLYYGARHPEHGIDR